MSQIIKVNVDSRQAGHKICKEIIELQDEHKFLYLTIRPGHNRGVELNSMFAELYTRIGRLDDFEGFTHARAHCKLYHGLPILARDVDGFKDEFNRVMRGEGTAYLLSMMNSHPLFPKFGFPVTSLFSVPQSTEYIDDLIKKFQDKVYFSDLLEEKDENNSTTNS